MGSWRRRRQTPELSSAQLIDVGDKARGADSMTPNVLPTKKKERHRGSIILEGTSHSIAIAGGGGGGGGGERSSVHQTSTILGDVTSSPSGSSRRTLCEPSLDSATMCYRKTTRATK